jgi:hypothetical protein
MKKALFLLTALSCSLFADEAGTVTVAGDRVSLRAAPEITAVLLDRMMSGDKLVLTDNSNPEWVGVVPPETVDLWVHSEFIKNGSVIPPKLNVRSGPSLNHSIVGVLTNGQAVTVRKELAEWVCIAPTSDSTAWISRKYVNVAIPEPIEPEQAVVEIEEAAPVEKIVTAPTVEQVFAAVAQTPDVPEKLLVDPEKEQGVEENFSGVLKPTRGLLYRLVSPAVESVTVCYVRGNQEQMAAFAQLPLKLTGKTYWAKGMESPIIVPARIQVLSDPSEE